MARDRPEMDDERSAAAGAADRDFGGNTGLLGRRSYLKLAGATTAVAGFAAGVAAADDYDVIELDPGEYRVVRLDSGETFENVIFDQRARGAAASIVARGTNWTVRNVAFRGPFGHRERAFGVADTGGGTSRIENVYMGDGVESGVGDRRHPKFGLWVAPDHSGHLDISRMYVDGAHDNAFYGSAPGSNSNGQRGTIHFSDCFAKDSWVAGFRIARGTVENCTAINTSAGRNGRPLWVWPTEYHGDAVEIVDCDFVDGPYPLALDIGRDGRRTDVVLRDTAWRGRVSERGSVSIDRHGENGGEPDASPPDGCPTSVEAVFEGADEGSNEDDGSGAVGDGDYRTIEVAGQFAYRIEVDGEIEPAPDHAGWLEAGEAYGDGWAEWWLSGSDEAHTAWRFTGEVTDLRIEDHDGETDVRYVRIDGEEVDLADFRDGEGRLLLIEGADEGPSRYEFTVDGTVEASTDEGATIDDGLTVTDGVVSGSVANWRDAFRLDGELVELTIHGPATASLDGETLDPDAVGQRLPHAIEVEGNGSPASYEITIDGAVELDGDDPSNEVAVVSGTTVQHAIVDGVHRYRYAGTVTDVTVPSGDVTVRVDGETIDPDAYVDADLLPHAIVIDGADADGESSYAFDVDGRAIPSVYAGATVDPGDVVADGTVTGSVGDERDAFWFEGSLHSIRVDGDAALDVHYNARDR